MSQTEKPGIYVYQPLPPREDGRMYALGGLPYGVRFDGLTRDEADVFAEALNEIGWLTDQCDACGHVFRFESDGCPQCGARAAAPWVPRKVVCACGCASRRA